MKEITREVLRHVYHATPIDHTRSLPCGGLCVEFRRDLAPSHAKRIMLMTMLTAQDSIQRVARSIIQLVIGVFYVISARRASLAWRYFSGENIDGVS